MTPIEKAEELVQRFIDEAYAETTEQLYTPIAKKAALIAVDEILEITKRRTYNPLNWGEVTGVRYDEFWLQVKRSIEEHTDQ